MDTTEKIAGRVVGNTSTAESSVGFKADIQNMIERYAMENVDIARDFERILARENTRNDFIDRVTESVNTTEALSDSAMVSDSFYSNYTERLAQLIDNSCQAIARESVMTGYAPIVAYAPFFIKKQWVACVWKDVLMSEVATSPILNYKFEKRYLKTQDGTRYAIPDVYYSKDDMAKLYSEATGVDIDSSVAIDVPAANVNLLEESGGNYKYLVGAPVITDKANVLTPDIAICKVHLSAEIESHTYEADVNTDIRIDITTHNFVKGQVRYTVKDDNGAPKTGSDGKVIVIEDELVGNVNFDTGEITVIAVNDTIKKICLKGKTANRFNHNSLDVVRKTEKLQFLVPESGPRLNTPITVEEAADAIALAKIDMFADNVDMMGTVLANFQDNEIRSFAEASFAAQKQQPAKIDAIDLTVVESGFNTIPHGHYTSTVRDYIADAKEYFERAVEKMKYKLQTDQAVIMCVCHPTLVRYIKGDIKWVFSDQTDISGIKISYKMGIAISDGGDRIHVITSSYMKDSEGIRMFLIPTTNELITFKHIMHSIIVDRGYRSPVEPLVPNVMSTQRTLTFEVLPVQGVFTIDGRELYPEAKPVEILNVTPATPGASAPGVGG